MQINLAVKNFWLIKSKEKNILNVLDWSHKNKKQAQLLSIAEIVFALKSYVRDSLHS